MMFPRKLEWAILIGLFTVDHGKWRKERLDRSDFQIPKLQGAIEGFRGGRIVLKF